MQALDEYRQLIRAANQRVYTLAKKTPLDHASQLSQRLNNTVWLKREDQQPLFSYKLRGAFNFICALSAAQKKAGIVAASAGNHAQGVALAAQKEQIDALIVMPKTTPEIKVASVRRLPVDIVLHGNTYDEACDYAMQCAIKQSRTFVPPYDHPMVIAGQATVAVEIIEQHPGRPDIIFVPVGGGGLIAGVALYAKSIDPNIQVIGVEPDDAPCMYQALKENSCVTLEKIGIFADGAAVRTAGKEPFRIVKALVDQVILVNTDEICAAIKDTFEDTRAIPEPAGALALAGLKQYVADKKLQNKQLVSIFSGANVNFDRLRHIAELSALGANKEALIATTLPEQPGSFRRFCYDLGPRAITEFNYRYANNAKAQIFAGIQLKKGAAEKKRLIQSLTQKGYTVIDLSDNDMAKMHIRYMVGGHAPQAKNELLYRFEFPERPGALLHFLTKIGARWNISLFHYRNHGAAYGRVLMGIQVNDTEYAEFHHFLDDLQIKYWAENDNPAYQLFLN